MRAEFTRVRPPESASEPASHTPASGAPTDAPVVGIATWTGTRVLVEPGDDVEAADSLRRIFRATPAAVDDPSLRAAGTSGPSVLEPGDLRWFLAAARTRAPAEGLSVRFVPPREGMGWDPAGTYRTFDAAVARHDRRGTVAD